MSPAFDLVVVGAGIHGAGLMQAAAAAGYSVLLLEQQAIAAATSSRSSKLIHGGLRYLETGQFRLVHESLRERGLLLRLAPELVHLARFHVPMYRRTRRRPWQLRVGLSLYALLSGGTTGAGFGTLPRRDWPKLDGLDTRDLQAVFYYYDAQTDDAALTRAVVGCAQRLGGKFLCPARCTGATLVADGVEVQYRTETPAPSDRVCHARVLVNAAGAWADTLARALEPPLIPPRIERVQGSHLILPLQLERGCYYLESPRDGRAIFALPWKGHTLLGTTETRYRGPPAEVRPTPSEVHYLLGVWKHYFPGWRGLKAQDVLESFAGLRVLPSGPGHAFHRSRETLLALDRAERPRVLSIYGGKLTTWRAVSERALERVAASLPRRRPLARTDRLPLTPSDPQSDLV